MKLRPESNGERKARIVADAIAMGNDSACARKHRIGRRTLIRWRQSVRDAPRAEARPDRGPTVAEVVREAVAADSSAIGERRRAVMLQAVEEIGRVLADGPSADEARSGWLRAAAAALDSLAKAEAATAAILGAGAGAPMSTPEADVELARFVIAAHANGVNGAS
jgi:hypothetical protein